MIWGPHCMIEMRRNNSVSSIRNIFIKFLLSLSLMLKYRHCWPFEMNTDSELQIENTLLCYFDRCAAGCGEELLQIISIITDITNNFTSRRMTLNCVQCPRIQALKAAAARHRYTQSSHLKMGSIYIYGRRLWLDFDIHQPTIFWLVNPGEHSPTGTHWCIVGCSGEGSLVVFQRVWINSTLWWFMHIHPCVFVLFSPRDLQAERSSR